jgi:hypothetical protein
MKNAQKKLDALRAAVDVMSSEFVSKDHVEILLDRYPDIFDTLADLRMDLLDVIDEEKWSDA